jgi:hypothetical protein
VYLSWPFRVSGVGALDISRINKADASDCFDFGVNDIGCFSASHTCLSRTTCMNVLIHPRVLLLSSMNGGTIDTGGGENHDVDI